MPRRKTPLAGQYHELSKKDLDAKLYGASTEKSIRDIKTKWKEYCCEIAQHPRSTLVQADPVRILNFFRWYLNNFKPEKVSSLITYYHTLSQLYTVWTKGQTMNKMLKKQVYTFISKTLQEECNLDIRKAPKPILDEEDFKQVLKCHWVTDTNTYPEERQRVQLATLLLLAAYTGSRPKALLSITYQDLDLAVVRNAKTGAVKLMLTVQFRITKGKSGLTEPKKFVFSVDTNPLICIVSHFIALACDDQAFRKEIKDLTPEQIMSLGVINGLNNQSIPWGDDWRNKPVFRSPKGNKSRGETGEDRLRLSYDTYKGWLQRLGAETGFSQVLQSYCLRRGFGNAVNDDPQAPVSIRNLTLDHANPATFEANYLSRTIRYDTKAAFLGGESNLNWILASTRMSRFQDPRRPIRLSEDQKEQARQNADVQRLIRRRHDLARRSCVARKAKSFDEVNRLEEERESADQEVSRLVRTRRAELLRHLQAEHDSQAPMQDMLTQLAVGDKMEQKSTDMKQEKSIHYSFEERYRIAEAFLSPPIDLVPTDQRRWQVAIINQMVLLCRREESAWRRNPRKRKAREATSPVKSDDAQADEPHDPNRSLFCDAFRDISDPCRLPFECLFCLSNIAKPLQERITPLKTKYSLQRHMQRYHPFRPGSSCPFEQPSCKAVTFSSEIDLKCHFAREHGILL